MSKLRPFCSCSNYFWQTRCVDHLLCSVAKHVRRIQGIGFAPGLNSNGCNIKWKSVGHDSYNSKAPVRYSRLERLKISTSEHCAWSHTISHIATVWVYFQQHIRVYVYAWDRCVQTVLTVIGVEYGIDEPNLNFGKRCLYTLCTKFRPVSGAQNILIVFSSEG